MCIVSNVGDSYRDQFPKRWPEWVPNQQGGGPGYAPNIIPPAATKEEVDELRKEIRELRELLKAAKKFDESTGQPDCAMDEKVSFIKGLADLLGVDMSEVFGSD